MVGTPAIVHINYLLQLDNKASAIFPTGSVINVTHHPTCLIPCVDRFLKLGAQSALSFVTATTAAFDLNLISLNLVLKVLWRRLSNDQPLLELHGFHLSPHSWLKKRFQGVLDLGS